jgi:hypothetical protein
MSLPNNIYVTPSTTFVQVNPLQNPYTPVLLNAVSYPGQTVTILDTTSSIGAFTTPIVVSTQALTFADGTISTVINQPQGFITAQTLSTNKWDFLNSFPFRNQYVSAGLLNLTTSSLFTALISTKLEYVSSLNVENLTVTGNFIQSQGLTLNTNVSSLGTVEFVSSLAVWDNVFLSSDMEAFGGVRLFSSLTVSDNLFTRSSIVTNSSFFVSSSLYALGGLSTSGISFQDGLVGTTLEIQQSTFRALTIAGSTEIAGNLSTLSSVNTGSAFEFQTLLANSVRLLSSASLYAETQVDTETLLKKSLSTTGSLGVGGGLIVDLNFTASGSIQAYSAYIRDRLTVASTIQLSTLIVNTMDIHGDFANNSTIATIGLNCTTGDLGAGFVSASNTVFKTLTAFSSIQTKNALINTDTILLSGSLSTFSIATSPLFTGTNILQNLSVLSDAYYSTLTVYGKTDILQNTQVAKYVSVNQDVYILGSIGCSTFQISSATFPCTIVANDITTDSLLVGTYGITEKSIFSTVFTSSFTYGYIPSSSYPFDLSGNFNYSAQEYLSTRLLSTTLFKAEAATGFTQLYVRAGMGVGVQPANSTFESRPIGYFLNNALYVFSTLSTNVVEVADVLDSYLLGNGAALSNFQYPKNLSALVLYISSTTNMNSEGYLNTSTFLTSTLNSFTLNTRSTMVVGTFNLYGDTRTVIYGIPRNILQTNVTTNNLILNSIDFIGNTTNPQVLVNYDGVINPSCNQSLRVYSTLGATSIGRTDYILTAQTYKAQTIITENVFGTDSNPVTLSSLGFTGFGSVYISSGSISTTTGKFFIGEQELYDTRFNIVQPYQSTLQFNSTLFVNRKVSSVGINCQPNFNLDAKRLAIQGTSYAPNGATTISNQINLNPNNSTFFYAFLTENGTYSNVIYSSNLVNWINADFLYNLTNLNSATYAGYVSEGLSRTSNEYTINEYNLTEYFLGQALFASLSSTPYSLVAQPSYLGAKGINPFTLNFQQTYRTGISDGNFTLVGGTYNPSYVGTGTEPILSRSGFFASIYQFYNIITSVIFPRDGVRSNGCYGLSFVRHPPSTTWLAVGYGSNSASIYVSNDVETWTESGNGTLVEARATLGLQEVSSMNEYFVVAGANTAVGANVTNGTVAMALMPSLTWVKKENLFTGSALCLATDGNILVVGGEDSLGQTLYYVSLSNLYKAYFNTPFQPPFAPCQGSVFPVRTNAVLWNGFNWVASGDSGIRQSSDGIVWSNPTSLTMEIFNVAYASNACTAMSVGNSNQSTPLLFLDSPYPSILSLVSAPTVSFYPSSILNLNNACILDAAQNMIVAGGPFLNPSPLSGTPFASTFYVDTAYISSVLSTSKLTVGVYNVGIQSI